MYYSNKCELQNKHYIQTNVNRFVLTSVTCMHIVPPRLAGYLIVSRERWSIHFGYQ